LSLTTPKELKVSGNAEVFCSHEMSQSTSYFGQQNESTKTAEPEPGFENTQTLSKKLIISISKFLSYLDGAELIY
jgi:hypothetical protein